MLKPDELQLLGLMLDRLRGCACLTVAQRNLVLGMAQVLDGNRPQNLYPQQFTLIEKLHGRCTAGRCTPAAEEARADADAVPAGNGDGR